MEKPNQTYTTFDFYIIFLFDGSHVHTYLRFDKKKIKKLSAYA